MTKDYRNLLILLISALKNAEVRPAQDHAPVEFSPGADTRGLAALSDHLIDGAFDHRIASEDGLDRALQILQEAPQVLPEAAEGLEVFLALHAR